MELHNLKPAPGATKKEKRLGRGQGSGYGGTSTRGHKGAQSRSGYKNKRNFEGGQMPLQMRLPKRGFKSPFRVRYVPLNFERLNKIVEKYQLKEISVEKLVELGIVGKKDRVKVLAKGELAQPLKLTVHACSEAARQAIEAKGGSIQLV